MSRIALDGVRKRFGATTALDGVDLEARDGELLVVVGPSGCGKSTLLRCVAGLEAVDEGAIRIGERDVTRVRPAARNVSMVFQSYALFPHLTVRENIAFGLVVREEPKQVVNERVAEASATSPCRTSTRALACRCGPSFGGSTVRSARRWCMSRMTRSRL
jgi:ABC-type sugar transport system ATPase subunit